MRKTAVLLVLALATVSFGFGNHGSKGTCPKLDQPDPVTVPAPAAILLGAVGTGAVGWFRRKRMI